MALRKNLPFLKKKKQKDFFNYAELGTFVLSCCSGIAASKNGHNRATIESIAKVFLLLFLQKKKPVSQYFILGWTLEEKEEVFSVS